ncbi:MAG: hypothetical protein R2878_04755 [Thermoleophilia bacterium]
MPLLRTTVLVAAIAGCALCGSAAGAPVGEQLRVTEHGPPNDATTPAVNSAVAYNSLDDEYLLVWEGGVPGVFGKTDIYGRLLDRDGRPRGNEFRISTTDGDQLNDGVSPDVVFDPIHQIYYVVWEQRTGPTARSDIIGKRVSRTGVPDAAANFDTRLNTDPLTPVTAEDPAAAWNAATGHIQIVWSETRPGEGGPEIVIGDALPFAPNGFESPGPLRISNMGGTTPGYSAVRPDIAYDPQSKEFLVVWSGLDNSPPVLNSGFEIFGQRVRLANVPNMGVVFQEVGPDTRISDMGPDGASAYYARNPSVAFDAGSGRFLVAWEGVDGTTPLLTDGQEIYGRRVAFDKPDGISLLGPDTQYSDMGPAGDDGFSAQHAAVSAHPLNREFLVTWDGDDNTPPLKDNEEEVFGQRVAADGAQIGADTVISDMGPSIGSTFYRAARPAVDWNSASGRWLVAWQGDDDSIGVGQLGVDDEFEIWTRQFASGDLALPPGTASGGGIPGSTGPPAAPACAITPPRGAPTGGRAGTLKLSAGQLRINQLIGQAAVRRANAIQKWLDDGIVGSDLCGGTLAPSNLDTSIAVSSGVLRALPGVASPRPVQIAVATRRGGRVTLSIAQMRTNQRVYAAAVRRANALKARFEGKLTGADIRDGTLGRDRLRQDLTITDVALAVAAPPTQPAVATPRPRKPAQFRLTLAQLRVNQKIAQAAVRRTNELRELIAGGLKGENFQAGTISAADLAGPPGP